MTEQIFRSNGAFTPNASHASKMLQVQCMCTLIADAWHFALDLAFRTSGLHSKPRWRSVEGASNGSALVVVFR